ncbi:MAG: hypothetical protein AAF790_05430 [Planctomycetota bacterium]
MPNRSQGYVHRQQGLRPQSQAMATCYKRNQRESTVTFCRAHQQTLVRVLLESQSKQGFDCLGIATDPTHVHTVVAWRDERRARRLRVAIKSSLSRGMNTAFSRRSWLSEGGSCKRLRDQRHLDYLLEHYLPKHSGLVWIAGRGFL